MPGAICALDAGGKLRCHRLGSVVIGKGGIPIVPLTNLEDSEKQHGILTKHGDLYLEVAQTRKDSEMCDRKN